MRSRFIAFFIAALFMAGSVMAQTITYTAKKASLESAIGTIKKQTGYSVMYNPDILSGAGTVTIDAKDMPLKEFLEKILTGNPLKYSIENKTIFIKHDHSKMNQEDGGGFRMVRIFHVSGKVTGENGEVLPLVSVAIVNSPYGGTTDKSGYFTLHEVQEKQTLTFTYMGYKKLSVTIAACCGKEALPAGVTANMVDPSNLSLTVSMEPTIKSLEEIAVANTGYQIVNKATSAGSMATINEKELNSQLNNNLTTALEGKVAGVSFFRGTPIIRGISTISTDSSSRPLLVIDGMITEGSMSDINVYDIASVTVLKDAAAASIYGARAANGVIVLTTKSGKKGAGVQISVNADHFITTKPDIAKMHYATTSQLIDYETAKYNYELNNYGGSTDQLFASYGAIGGSTIKYYSPLYALYKNQADGTVTQDDVDNTLAQWRNNDYIRDYTKYVWKNEMKQRYNISLSNATDKSNTFVSVNYEGNQQRVKNNTSDILSLYFKNTFNINKWLDVTADLNGRYSDEQATYADYNTYELQPRYATILDANGNKVYADYVNSTDGFSGSDGMNAVTAAAIEDNSNFKSVKFNILDELNNGLTKKNTLWLRAFTELNIHFSKHLKYGAKIQYETSRQELRMQNEEDSYRMRYLYNAMTSYSSTTGKYTHNLPTGDRLYMANSRARNFTFRQQLDYNNDFKIAGKNSTFYAIAGMETRELYTPGINSSLIYGYNPVTLSSTLVDWYTMTENGINSYLYGSSTTLSYTPGKIKYITRHRYVSFYGNFSYTFNDRYNLTGSVRADQTDLFGTDPKYRYRPLWSVGGGWNATNEHFMQNVSWLNYLKVRATYGIGGNVDQSTSPFITATLKSDNLYPSLQYTNIGALPNPKLRWEKTATLNFGVDYTIFNHVLDGSIDYYRKYSSDLLATTDLDPTVGSTSQRINNGAMSNRGVEVTFNSTWYNKGELTFASRLTFAYNKNRIEKITHSVTDGYSLIASPNDNYYAGTPYNALYAYQYAGMTNGYPTFYDQDGKVNVTFDQNGTPTAVSSITKPAAVKLMGTTAPRYSAFFQQMIGYKGFELTANLAYYGGHKMRKDAISLNGFTQTDESLARRYTDNNQNTDVPRLQIDYPASMAAYASTLSTLYSYSDIQVVSAASMRLRNVALAYALSGKYCKLLHVKGIRLTAQANNLWLWTANNDDIDPETFSLNTGYRNLPTPKSYLFGASLTF